MLLLKVLSAYRDHIQDVALLWILSSVSAIILPFAYTYAGGIHIDLEYADLVSFLLLSAFLVLFILLFSIVYVRLGERILEELTLNPVDREKTLWRVYNFYFILSVLSTALMLVSPLFLPLIVLLWLVTYLVPAAIVIEGENLSYCLHKGIQAIFSKYYAELVAFGVVAVALTLALDLVHPALSLAVNIFLTGPLLVLYSFYAYAAMNPMIRSYLETI